MSIVPFVSSSFKREAYIKDLFKTHHLLNIFEESSFESLETYLDCVNNNLIKVGTRNNIIINIRGLVDFKKIKKVIIASPELFSSDFFTLNIPLEVFRSEDLYLFLEENNPKFSLTIDLDYVTIEDIFEFQEKAKERFATWFGSNVVSVYTTLTKDNYRNNISSIIEIFNKTSFRFFFIDFDFESLLKMTFEEFEEMRLRLQEFSTWKQGDWGIRVQYFNRYFKRVLVDKDFKLYINKFAKRDGVYFLDLNKYPLEATGEDISDKDLNIFRSYVDFPKYVGDFLTMDKSNHREMIDPYFNKKLTRSYTFIPTVTKNLILSLI
jgi:hypothetical protein